MGSRTNLLSSNLPLDVILSYSSSNSEAHCCRELFLVVRCLLQDDDLLQGLNL